jgi:hypothetical protein
VNSFKEFDNRVKSLVNWVEGIWIVAVSNIHDELMMHFKVFKCNPIWNIKQNIKYKIIFINFIDLITYFLHLSIQLVLKSLTRNITIKIHLPDRVDLCGSW